MLLQNQTMQQWDCWWRCSLSFMLFNDNTNNNNWGHWIINPFLLVDIYYHFFHQKVPWWSSAMSMNTGSAWKNLEFLWLMTCSMSSTLCATYLWLFLRISNKSAVERNWLEQKCIHSSTIYSIELIKHGLNVLLSKLAMLSMSSIKFISGINGEIDINNIHTAQVRLQNCQTCSSLQVRKTCTTLQGKEKLQLPLCFFWMIFDFQKFFKLIL